MAKSHLLGGDARYCYVGKGGYLNVANLIGQGMVNNPFYDNDFVVRIQTVPDDDLMTDRNGDGLYDRSKFDSHSIVELAGKIYDATIGPHLGSETLASYLLKSFDRSQPEEQKAAAEESDVQCLGIRIDALP